MSSFFITTGGDFDINPSLILYTDGQLIMSSGQEKQLSQEEIDEIFANLTNFGFFQIESTYPIDEDNPIYSFPIEGAPVLYGMNTVVYMEAHGIESNGFGYMAQWEQYLNQPIPDIISYLANYSTSGTTPYKPDRLLLAMTEINLSVVTNQPILPWPKDLPPPSEGDGLLYLDGLQAAEIYNLVKDNLNALYAYQEMIFWLIPRPIYPHECKVSRFVLRSADTASQPLFFCDEP